MKIALLICTYNRPSYLRQTLESLKRADLSDVDILIVDDCSTDSETLSLIEPYTVIINATNSSIKQSLLTGFSTLFAQGYDIVINLDSDALVRNDFINVLLDLHTKFPYQLITGFNCDTLNKNGSIRHDIIEQGEGYNIKQSVGGINMLITKHTFAEYVFPALTYTLANHGNWDQRASLASDGVICAEPSIIQHIGYESSMGHAGSGELPDTSSDFKSIYLPNVTLLGLDSVNAVRLQMAADNCTKDIQFGAVKLLTDLPIKSKEQYSEWCIKEMYKHFDTDYVMVFQHDGYILDASKWEDEFLNYDYIGAPWEWYGNAKVGNGGFSIRSKKLMQLIATDPVINDYHPEDDKICRKYGDYLKEQGIAFAPIDLARRFSLEGYKADRTYRGQFGFHGQHIQFKEHSKKAIILQPHGLGDVIFSQTLIHSLGDYEITWPVKPHFVDDLNRAYPQFKFISDNESPVDLTIKRDMIVSGFRTIPIRWSDSLMRTHYRNVMRAKYDMYKKNYRSWKERAYWNRNEEKENELYNLLCLPDGYKIINTTFGCDLQHKIDIQAEGIHMQNIEGYSLFDWAKVLENASEIHTVSTSLLFILDLLETCPVHVYIRRPIERDHSNYNYIFTDRKFVYR